MWQALSLCTLLCCLTSALDSQNFFYYPYDNLNNIERKHTEDRSPSHPPLTHPITIHPQNSSSALRIVLQQPRPLISYRSHLCILYPYVHTVSLKCHCHSSQSSRHFFSGFIQLTLSCLWEGVFALSWLKDPWISTKRLHTGYIHI